MSDSITCCRISTKDQIILFIISVPYQRPNYSFLLYQYHTKDSIIHKDTIILFIISVPYQRLNYLIYYISTIPKTQLFIFIHISVPYQRPNYSIWYTLFILNTLTLISKCWEYGIYITLYIILYIILFVSCLWWTWLG